MLVLQQIQQLQKLRLWLFGSCLNMSALLLRQLKLTCFCSSDTSAASVHIQAFSEWAFSSADPLIDSSQVRGHLAHWMSSMMRRRLHLHLGDCMSSSSWSGGTGGLRVQSSPNRGEEIMETKEHHYLHPPPGAEEEEKTWIRNKSIKHSFRSSNCFIIASERVYSAAAKAPTATHSEG